MSSSIALILIAVATLIWRQWYRKSKVTFNSNTLPLPPGPKPLPIIGNFFDVPTSHAWLKVAEWSKVYGDIIHVHTLGTHIIYLNSLEHANELFQKRAANYSSRPILYMLYDVLDAEWVFSLRRYGLEWRELRKMFHQHFHQGVVQEYRPLQLLEARKMLFKLLETPADFFQHIRYSTAATIMRITYGIEIEDYNDPNVAAAELAMQHLADAATPGAFTVDILPILKYVPEWFPGGGYKKIGRAWKADLHKSRDLPYQMSKKLLEIGKSLDSVTASILRKNMNPSKEEEELIMSATGTAYLGGADTTVSTIQSFFQAIALHPEVQLRAQKELDDVLGPDRLPEFEDRASLPYVEAIVKESFRWRPILPLGVAHLATEEDEYNGYRIPKGTVMVANQWAMLHNEDVYPEPYLFRPERFLDANGNLNPSVPNPELATFGFGKRICPGRHMASNTAFITMASVLATLNIQPAVDQSGEKIPISDETTPGLLSYPVPFKCSIKPRSQAKINLIHRSLGRLGEGISKS